MRRAEQPQPYLVGAAAFVVAAVVAALGGAAASAALLSLAAAMFALQAALLHRTARTGLPREVERLRASLLLGADERLLELGGGVPPGTPDASVDAVLGVRVLDALPDEAGREALRREVVRVLRPGGRVALLDTRATHETALALEDLGLTDVQRSGLRWAVWPPARSITAHRPG